MIPLIESLGSYISINSPTKQDVAILQAELREIQSLLRMLLVGSCPKCREQEDVTK